jgi:biopolymer transport protein ExbB/TolQ
MEHIAPSLTPIGLFLQAGPVAKAVLMLLLAVSIWCWMLIIEATIGIRRLKKAIRAARATEGDSGIGLLAPIIAAGYRASAVTISGESVGEARTRIADCMQRAAQTLLAGLEGGLPNLAVISSVAPFIGLFGTVWGIMISFSSIAQAADTSLAVVAPGIAEALAATAVGLAAAIPATIGYNRLGSSLARAAQQLQHLIDEDAIKIIVARSAPRGSEVR